MSYARCGSQDSDVYVYASTDWHVNICSETHDHREETYTTLGALFRRLQELNASGVRVPESAFVRIKREIMTNSYPINDGRVHCPYCEAVASNVMVHTDVGNELDDHYHCPWCRAEEMPFDAELAMPTEKLTRWYEPPYYSWYWDQTRFPEEEIPF